MCLVEREALLQGLADLLAGAAGQVALLAGEAGIGKTSVLRAAALAHAARGGTVWWGACDALETPHPLAPLLDIAREAAPRFASRLSGPRPALFEAVLDELRAAPGAVLVVIEDAHWADDATLDLLKYLGRRIERARAVLAISYRDDEIGLSHPLRRVLGELPPTRRTLLEVPRLTPAGVQVLAQRLGGRADGVHEATRGNAFFATELLRDTGQPRARVPRSVQDVVLARFARLPAPVQALLQGVAVVPGRAERWLVDALLAPSLADVEAALDSGLLVSDGPTLGYRHELARVAVDSSMSAPLSQDWHRRVLAALTAPGHEAPAARRVHHAAAAHDAAAISRYAPQAAREATARGAFREAAAQWRMTLKQGRPRDDAERMAWLDACAEACAAIGLNEETLAALRELEQLARAQGDLALAARARARQASPYIGLLRHADADQAVRDARALVDTMQPPSATHAMVWAAECWQRMLERDYAQSIEWGGRAIALARSLGEALIRDRAELATGAALLFVDLDAGRRRLLALAEQRRAAGSPHGVCSVLGMIGSGCGELMRLPEAEGYLREALALAEAHDLNGLYPAAWLALCLMLRGRWDEAASRALEVTTREHDSDMSRLMALLALARVRLRRGDPGVAEALHEARTLAYGSGTLQRLAPTACARAEAAFQRGDLAAVRDEVSVALPLARAKGHPWFVGELSYWLWRAGGAVPATAGCAEPYALEIAGCWRDAAQAWLRVGCPYEHARALSLGDAEARQQALAAFDALGAAPAAEALRRQLREAGVRGVARGPRPSTRAHPVGLTAAETRILALLAEGLRNADIAARIHRSVRTVDHHVAAVLAKLGAATRHEAIVRARREGWLP
jgi:DNA-binding CsgD family transcriptional regulator